MANINFVALGGLDDHGKNMYAIQINEDIIVIDGGDEKPSSKIYGVKTIIADTTWLQKNQQNIKAVFLSNYQDDHIAAIPYLLKSIPNLNVYGSALSLTALNFLINKDNLQVKANFEAISTVKIVNISNSIRVKFFKLTSQSLGHYGLIIETPDGNIIYASDFVYSNETIKAFAHDMNKLPLISKKNLLLLVGARYGKTSGFTAPAHKVSNKVAPFIRNSYNKTFFACYDRDIYTIFEIIKIIGNLGRPIAFINPLTEKIIKTAIQHNLIRIGKSEIIPINNLKNHPSCAVFITDSYKNLYSTISKLVRSQNQDILINENDKFLMIAPPIPGNEGELSQTLDEVVKIGCNVKVISEKERKFTWASEEDIKTMVGLTRPKYVVPIRGLYRDLSIASEFINDCGIDQDKIILLDNGQVISIHNGMLQKKSDFKLKIQEKFVEGNSVSNLSPIVLSERNQMAENGILTVSFILDKKNQAIASNIDIKFKGLIRYSEDTQDYFEELKQQTEKIVIDLIKSKEESNEMKRRIKNFVVKKCIKTFNKEPVVLVAIAEI